MREPSAEYDGLQRIGVSKTTREIRPPAAGQETLHFIFHEETIKMSDYHIREAAADKKTINVVFHLPIPATNNTVGTAWRTALVAHQGGADAISSALLDIAAEDLTAMKAGSLFERVRTMRFSSISLTNAERLAEVAAAYSDELATVTADLQATLDYYGRVGDV